MNTEEIGVLDLDHHVPRGLVAPDDVTVHGAPAWLPDVIRALAVERAQFGVVA